MKSLYTVFIALALMLALPGLALASDLNYGSATVKKVDRVYDGDTIYVTVNKWPSIIGHNIPVRINGIDTPEVRGAGCEVEKALAEKAKARIIELFDGSKKIYLRNLYRGKYFRIIADVYADDVNIAETLISEGLAHPYDGGTRLTWCPVDPSQA